MSYSLAVTVTDGVASVDESGTSLPPDGKFVINGHVPVEGTWQAENVQVTRQDVNGNVVIQASGTHYLG